MADYATSQGGGHHAPASAEGATLTPQSNSLTFMMNLAGAAISLALLIGIGVWGYQLLSRDVSGIPVVRAAEGEMRVRPEDPGGQLAQHTGTPVVFLNNTTGYMVGTASERA